MKLLLPLKQMGLKGVPNLRKKVAPCSWELWFYTPNFRDLHHTYRTRNSVETRMNLRQFKGEIRLTRYIWWLI